MTTSPVQLGLRANAGQFWLLVLVGIGSLLYSYYYIRRQQRAKLEQIRNRIATDLHDDMGSTLSSIRIFSDVARSQLLHTQPQVVPMLEKNKQ